MIVGKAGLRNTTTILPVMSFASELTHLTKKKQIVVCGKNSLIIMIFMRFVILGKALIHQEVIRRVSNVKLNLAQVLQLVVKESPAFLVVQLQITNKD